MSDTDFEMLNCTKSEGHNSSFDLPGHMASDLFCVLQTSSPCPAAEPHKCVFVCVLQPLDVADASSQLLQDARLPGGG